MKISKYKVKDIVVGGLVRVVNNVVLPGWPDPMAMNSGLMLSLIGKTCPVQRIVADGKWVGLGGLAGGLTVCSNMVEPL